MKCVKESHLRKLVAMGMTIPEISVVVERSTNAVIRTCRNYGIQHEPYDGPNLCHRGHSEWSSRACKVCQRKSRMNNYYRTTAVQREDQERRHENIAEVLKANVYKTTALGARDANGVLHCGMGHTDPNRWVERSVPTSRGGYKRYYCQECAGARKKDRHAKAIERQAIKRRKDRLYMERLRHQQQVDREVMDTYAKEQFGVRDVAIGGSVRKSELSRQAAIQNQILHLGDKLNRNPMPWEREAIKAEMAELQKHIKM
jgi:hypothetical protein